MLFKNFDKALLSPFRILENGKKSCILHGTLTSHCGCADAISQLDSYQYEETVVFEDSDLQGFFSPVSEAGTYRRSHDIQRKVDRVEASSVYKKV